MKYKVYFEIGGHKMQKEVEANNKHEAQALVADTIIFHSVKHAVVVNKEPVKNFDSNSFDNIFKTMFGGNIKFK